MACEEAIVLARRKLSLEGVWDIDCLESQRSRGSNNVFGHDTRKIGFSGIMEEVKKVPRLSFICF